jgi:hypothetical protein
VRTADFKDRVGDWEALAIQEQVDDLINEAVNNGDLSKKVVLRQTTQEEVAEVKRQGGPDITGLSHEITAKELRHALKTHSKPDEAIKTKNLRPLTAEDLKYIPTILDAPDGILVQPRGTNKTSIIYEHDFGDGAIRYVERVIETSNENKPRLTIKTIRVKGAEDGVKSGSAMVYTPYRNSSIMFSAGRVNPSSVTIPLDENGEPVFPDPEGDNAPPRIFLKNRL